MKLAELKRVGGSLLLGLLAGTGCHTRGVAQASGRARSIDVKHIALDLRFDWTKRQAVGTATIILTPLRATDRIALDAGRLTISAVSDGQGTPLPFSYDGGDRDDGLVIALGQRRSTGQDLTVRIAYHTNWASESDPNSLGGSNGKGLRFFSPTFTEPLKRRQLWSMGEPQSNRYWFPSYDSPDDFRTTELTATVERPLLAISNGALVSTVDNPDGTRTFHWKADRPYANHQTSIVVGEYTEVRQEWNGIPLRTFGYPDERDAVAASVVRLPDMIRFFSEKTGVRYPFPSYSQVFVQDLPWGTAALGASTLTENMVDDAPTHEDYRWLWDGLGAESLALQWFGGHLSARDWRHIWLNRGFAMYFDGLYNEYKNGRPEMLLWHILNGAQATTLGDWNGGNRHPVVPADLSQAESFANDNYPYMRGGLVLHMLRKHLGDEVWWRAIRHYLASNAGKAVTTEDFRRAVEDVSGESLDWFFDQWLYKTGHPIFEVTTDYDAGKRQLRLIVTQTQTKDSAATYPQVEFFQGKMDVGIDGTVQEIWLDPKQVNTYTFAAPVEPKLVNFDREGIWLKEVRFRKTAAGLVHQMLNDSDIVGRVWAVNEAIAMARSDSTPSADKATIYEGFRQVIDGNAYWRLRFITMLRMAGLPGARPGAAPSLWTEAMTTTVLASVERDTTWVRSAAVGLLATTRNPRYADRYLALLRDRSHPVTYAAAAALGQTKSAKAFRALADLTTVPSWKGENILSGLLGLKELGDPRGGDIALRALKDQSAPRWYLAWSRWDYRIAAAETLRALGQADKAYPIVLQRFRKSLEENDVNDIFSNVLLVSALGDPRGEEVFAAVTARFKDDANAMNAINTFRTQFDAARPKS